MITLVRIEIRRVLARRLWRWLTVLAALALVVSGLLAFYESANSPLRFADIQWMLASLGVIFMMLGWLLGASAVGAEWTPRTMTSLLTWEPRRARVLTAKVISVAVIVWLWILLIQALFTAVLLPSGWLHGTMEGVDGAWWTDHGTLMLRIAGVSVMAAVLGFSLAATGRNTAAALGIGFVYLAVVEGLIRGFRPQWVDWLVGDNAALLMIGSEDVTHLGHSQAAAGLLLLSYCAVMFIAALWVFRAREVS